MEIDSLQRAFLSAKSRQEVTALMKEARFTHAIPVMEIAAAAGVSRDTVYKRTNAMTSHRRQSLPQDQRNLRGGTVALIDSFKDRADHERTELLSSLRKLALNANHAIEQLQTYNNVNDTTMPTARQTEEANKHLERFRVWSAAINLAERAEQLQ